MTKTLKSKVFNYLILDIFNTLEFERQQCPNLLIKYHNLDLLNSNVCQ
jgi:hypothetical protein